MAGSIQGLFMKGIKMIRRQRLRGPTITMSIYLDPDTDLRLLKAKDRSGRSKSQEALLRLRDHLLKYPDFYNSEMVEVIPNNLSKHDDE